LFNLINELHNIKRIFWQAGSVGLALVLSACSSTPLLPTEPTVQNAPTVIQTTPPVTRAPQVVTPAPPVVAQAPGVIPPASTLPQTGTTPGTPGGYYQGDGPDANPPPNLETTQDPVPVAEPLNKFANEPYIALGQTFVPDKSGKPYAAAGIASWYGKQFHGRKTASGETYDMYAMTAAHPTLPIPSYARVTNRKNNKSVIVRVNDRGPFHANRVIDLSYTAALKLGYVQQGSTDVIVESISSQQYASNQALSRPASAPVGSSIPQPVIVAAAPATLIKSIPQPTTVISNQPQVINAAATVISSANNKPVYLQLGVFSNPTNANNFRDKILKDLAWLTEPIEIFIIDKLYRVRVGPYVDTNLARSTSSRIKGSLGISPILAPM
jgi:rare lipoprotein A